MKVSTRGPNVQKRHFGAPSIFFIFYCRVSELILGLSNFGHPRCFLQQIRSLIHNIKVRTPGGFLKNISRLQVNCSTIKRPKNLRKKGKMKKKMFYFTFLFGEVQNNNFRSFIHVKYLRSVKKSPFKIIFLDFL